ncbi:MAG: hypothetical protein JW944_05585 [Deltaproteobacteria bacterium]|nr:hypothetical protein [Deltaproteobacteria bacterium]
MINEIRSHLHLKLSLAITGGAVIVAAIASYIFYQSSYNNELDSYRQATGQLILTISNTAAISVYLDNDDMVSEVADSLLGNDIINQVIISNQDKVFYSSATQLNPSEDENWIEYPIASPFSEDTKIGSIFYQLNDSLIQRHARQVGFRNAATLMGHTLLITVMVMVLVYASLTIHLRRIAQKLHKINPGLSKERLPKPTGHQDDELGQLVNDINSLLDSADNVIRSKEELIEKLEKAAEEIKTLRGIIPICSNCKKIRDDAGIWNQIENYVTQHSEAEFSHSLCPDCVKKLYPDFALAKKSA